MTGKEGKDMGKRVAAWCAAVLLGLFGVVMLAGPAQADEESSLEQHVIDVNCGEVVLKLVNNHELDLESGPATYRWNIQTSDGQNFNLDLAYTDSPEIVTVELKEDSTEGSGWISFGVVAGPESDFFLANQTQAVGTDCEPEPSPSPSPSPEPSPSPSPTPEPTTSSTSEPTQDPGGSGGSADKGQDQLPVTGTSGNFLKGLVAVGAGLLLTGAGAVGFSRFRGFSRS